MDIDTYEKRVRNNVTDRTVRARAAALNRLDEFVDGEATVDDVETYMDALIDAHEDGEIKASVIREYFKSIKSYFRVVKGEPEALDHITWLPSTDSDPGDYLDEKEWERFFSSLRSYEDKAYFMMTYQYARRPTETLLLSREDIDLEKEQPTVTFSILKKSQSSNTPTVSMYLSNWDDDYEVYRTTYKLKGEAADHLKRWLDIADLPEEDIVLDGEDKTVHPVFFTGHGRRTYGAVYKKTKDVADRAGLEKNVTPKVLRHSRSTHLDWQGGAPGNIARDMLIHDPETNVISRYIHDRGEDEVRDVMGVE